MTRKDYIAIAGALAKVRGSYAPNWDPNLFRALDDVTAALADVLERDNPPRGPIGRCSGRQYGFHRPTFLAAAGASK